VAATAALVPSGVVQWVPLDDNVDRSRRVSIISRSFCLRGDHDTFCNTSVKSPPILTYCLTISTISLDTRHSVVQNIPIVLASMYQNLEAPSSLEMPCLASVLYKKHVEAFWL
jgi:hypothetical protein